MASCREIHESVWNRAVSLGAHVEYDRHLFFQPKGPKALFNPNETADGAAAPKILIASRGLKHDHLSDDEVATVLRRLAHEVGHFLWWRRGREGDAAARAEYLEMRAAFGRYEEVLSATFEASPDSMSDEDIARSVSTNTHRDLTDEQRRLIFAEEKRAWSLGLELLVEFGFEDIAAYNIHADGALQTYRTHLGQLD